MKQRKNTVEIRGMMTRIQVKLDKRGSGRWKRMRRRMRKRFERVGEQEEGRWREIYNEE